MESGIWRLEASYLPENIEYNYLAIKSYSTVESWTDRGLEQVFSISPEENTLVYKTLSVYFSVKFGEYFNTQHPAGHFNSLQKNPENRINFMAGTDWFGYFTAVGGNYVDGDGIDYSFKKGQYYSFRYHLKEESVDIYLDDNLLTSVNYPKGLPETGYFVFECHNEYWIKDFGFEIE